MNYTKELLLSAATILVSTGVSIIATDFWKGIVAIVLGVVIFIGRGFYKKYFG